MSHSLLRIAGLASLCLAFVSISRAQGCVAARGCGLTGMSSEHADQRWEATVSERYFKSHRHYVGGVEQVQRAEEGSEVINHSHFSDLALTYHPDSLWSVGVGIPYVRHDRSQALRGSNSQVIGRFRTQSSGLGDIRVEASRLLFAPSAQRKGNVQLGAGIALPTGRKDVRDTFTTYDAAKNTFGAVERTVDQSIQPGSGGYAILLSLASRYALTEIITAYADGSYAITPEETNGVPTYRSNPYEAVMSIADTYLARAGVEVEVYRPWGLKASLGLRAEGVPVRDLVGGSHGFRRPGYSIAVEPGISLDRGTWAARLYVPFAIDRNRLRSVADEQWTASSGTYRHGDAAFADYLIVASATLRF